MSDDSSKAAPSASESLERLVQEAERAGASDIHLQMLDNHAQVSFRLDGLMSPPARLPAPMAERVFGRIKYLSQLKTYEESLPQDGRIGKGEIGARGDIRVATYPTVTGEKIVLRLFSDSAAHPLDRLGLSDEAHQQLETFLRATSGLLLLTGPAGSGKTTTIYACLRRLAKAGQRHVITIEDPVEQIVPGIMQTEINEARGLDFARAARHLLRQDPQVLVIGEIRDRETADIVVQASLTGHLVISTLHAGSCRGVMERLLAMASDRYAVGSAIELIFNQRLLRRRCAQCQGERCDGCLQTGYRGRVPVVEWFRFDEVGRKAFRDGGPDIVQPAVSIEEAARELVASGVTNANEFERLFSR